MEVYKKGYLSVLEIPGIQMNLVLLPHAAENNCIKGGGSVSCEETIPVEVHSPGLKCSVMLDTQSCPRIRKTAGEDQKTVFDKAQVRQKEQIIKDNK